MRTKLKTLDTVLSSTQKVDETSGHTREIMESILERNTTTAMSNSVKKIKTLVVFKGNLIKVTPLSLLKYPMSLITILIVTMTMTLTMTMTITKTLKLTLTETILFTNFTKVPASLLVSTIASGLERVQLKECNLTGAEQIIKLLSQLSGTTSLNHLDLSENRAMFTNDEKAEQLFRTWQNSDLDGFPRFEDFQPGPHPPSSLHFIVNLESVNLSTCSLPKYQLWLILGALARVKTCRLRELDIQWNHIFFTAEEEVQILRLAEAKNVRILICNQSLAR